MTSNEQLITNFYEAFARRDFAAMAECYHPEATFSDPVFKDLKGRQIAAMWHMLCLNAQEFSVSFDSVQADESGGKARWAARYRFSGTGRKVYNRIRAYFTFKDGKIFSHRDRFSFWRWARMALGPVGLLLGGTELMRKRVQKNAETSLSKFLEKHPEYR